MKKRRWGLVVALGLAAGLIPAVLPAAATAQAVQQEEPPPPPPPPPPPAPEEAPAPVPAPAEPAPPPTDAQPTPTEEALLTPPPPERFHNGLYVAVGIGSASAETVKNQVETTNNQVARNEFSLEDLDHGTAALGWKLDEGKGSFRLMFNGYKESTYDYRSAGLLGQVVVGATPQQCLGGVDPCLLPWWDVHIVDGQMEIQAIRPTWSISQDANGNNSPDQDEVTIPSTPEYTLTRNYADTLQNQLQTWDLVYGRTFGGRRYASRWWGGLRYYEYKGNFLVGAWLSPSVGLDGAGFTEGALLMPINFAHEASGVGPTGSWEANFNFFDRRLALYLRGQAAFIFGSIEARSGEFHTLVETSTGGEHFLPAPAELNESRDKSTWQTTGELGGRYTMKNGLEFELAYTMTGFLDTLLTPTALTIPATGGQAPQGTSAIYKTRDYVVDGWHGSVGFQF